MEKTLVTSGKTIDLAIESALAQLGLDRDSVSVQVRRQAKSGFLGFGAQLAKVQVTYEAPDEAPQAPKVALSSASRKPKPAAPAPKPAPAPKAAPAAPKAEAKPEAPKAAPAAEAPKAEEPKAEAVKAPRPERADRPARGPKPPRAPRNDYAKEPREPREPKEPKEPKVYAPAPEGSVEEKIEVFLKGLVRQRGGDTMSAMVPPHTRHA